MRGSDRVLLAISAIVGVVVVVAVVLLLVEKPGQEVSYPPESPEGVLQGYLRALEQGRWEEADPYLTEATRKRIADQSFRRTRPSRDGSVSRRVLLQKSDVRGDFATVTVAISTFSSTGFSTQSEYTTTIHFELRKEGSQWKIQAPEYLPF